MLFGGERENKPSIKVGRQFLGKLSPSTSEPFVTILRKTRVPPKVSLWRNHKNFCCEPPTFFSVSIHLLMAGTEEPVRSFRATIASLMSERVVMVAWIDAWLCCCGPVRWEQTSNKIAANRPKETNAYNLGSRYAAPAQRAKGHRLAWFPFNSKNVTGFKVLCSTKDSGAKMFCEDRLDDNSKKLL